jgi:TRAP-type uncharacterized transport system substrate-binding protein
MEWYAGPQGGGWYTIAEGLVDLIKAHHHDLDLRITAGGGKENLAHIERGEAQFCMSIDFLAPLIHDGRDLGRRAWRKALI